MWRIVLHLQGESLLLAANHPGYSNCIAQAIANRGASTSGP